MSDFLPLLNRGFEPHATTTNRWERTEDDGCLLIVAKHTGFWTGQAQPADQDAVGCFTSADTADRVVDKLERFLNRPQD